MSRPHSIPDQERRSFLVELRADEDTSPTIEGYAAVFNQQSEPIMGLFREVIEPGAFKRALRGKPDVLALWNHDANYPLGRSTAKTLRLEEDDTGLRVEIDPPDVTWANDLMVSMRRGDVRQMSFAFTVQPKGETWSRTDDGMDLRTITQVERLFDVSVVAQPAYPQTKVAVRSAGGIDFEELYQAVVDGDQTVIQAAMQALGSLVEPEPASPLDWQVAAAHRRRVLELTRLQLN